MTAEGGYKDTIEVSTDDVPANYVNLGGLKNPNFPQSRGSIDASKAGDDFVDRIPGRFDNSATYNCIDDPTDAGQAILYAAFDADGDANKVWIRFMRNGVPRRKAQFIVTSANLTGDLDDTEMVEFNVESCSKPAAAPAS